MEYLKELKALGASDFQIASLADEKRGRAALAEAQRRGVDNPIPYAIKVYENTQWHGRSTPVVTNAHAEVKCAKCDGDRFVFVTDDWSALYGETVVPCAGCNAAANTAFYRTDGTRVKAVAQ